MKKSLVALYTLIALSIGVQASLAACPCMQPCQSNSYLRPVITGFAAPCNSCNSCATPAPCCNSCAVPAPCCVKPAPCACAIPAPCCEPTGCAAPCEPSYNDCSD